MCVCVCVSCVRVVCACCLCVLVCCVCVRVYVCVVRKRERKKMGAIEENLGGDSESDDVLEVKKKVDVPPCETFLGLNLMMLNKE